MTKQNDQDISNTELLEAIHAGFSAMQTQIDERFGQVDERFEGVGRRFDSIDQRFEESASEHAAINQKLDSTINRLDDHDRRLTKLETKVA